LRTSDYAFRVGGDEFALLLPQTDSEQSMALAKRLRTAFADQVEPMRLGVAVGLDYGVAVYPEDGGQKEALLGVADERLYQWKTYRRPGRTAEPAAETPAPGTPAAAVPPARGIPAAPARPAAPGVQESQPSGEERRKSERVALAGTKAYAQLADSADRTARVVDLSYGGVALEMSRPEEVGATFFAVLHVPILPPVRVSLRRVYFRPSSGETARIGCAFVT
jgi:hypothetical protein